jgi:hypothetical protein
VCVDHGIHIKIYEPSPFCKDWNSHKLGGSAVAYELVTCIATGDIVETRLSGNLVLTRRFWVTLSTKETSRSLPSWTHIMTGNIHMP